MSRSQPLIYRVIFVCLLALASPGFAQGCNCTCEECMSAGVRQRVEREEAQRYVYSAPISKTYGILGDVLSDYGWERPSEAPGFGATLRVRRKGGASDDEALVRFVPVGKDRYRVEIMRLARFQSMDGGTQQNEERDLQMEWELASRVDPAFAAKAEEKAEKARGRAAAVGRGCDRGCEIGCKACETCDRILR